MQNTTGVLLVALGVPEYGDLAANLAASIRVRDPYIPIHLVHTAASVGHLTDDHRALFTSMADCPQEYYRQPHRSTPDYIKAKTHLYDLSPFEETLFLDVDLLLLPSMPISATMSYLSSVCDFTIKNRGCDNLSAKYTHWFDVDEARRLTGPDARFYQCQSEFVFFKKTDANKIFFDKVREVYDHPPLPPADFRGGVPDEYAYNLAMAMTGTYPHADHYIPIYWYFLEGRKDWNKEILRDYIGFSIGGELIPDWISQKINAYRDYFRKSLQLPYLFNVPSKKRWKKQSTALHG
jgi:hypothetical protein